MKCNISWDPGTSYSGFPGQNSLEGILDHRNLQEVKRNCFALENPKFTDFFTWSMKKQAGCLGYTPPKFNIAPEKWWLEDHFPIGKVTFQGLC